MNQGLERPDLGQIALFRNLAEPDLRRVAGLARFTTATAGTSVVRAHEPGESVLALVRGSVKVHVAQTDGTEVLFAVLGPGEVLGEISVVDSLGRSASVTTLEDSLFLSLARSAFWACLRTMPTMAYNLTFLLCRRIRLANAHARCLATLDVSGRVALQLLALAREYGEPGEGGAVVIPLRLTQTDVAGLVGASRVRVNQAFATFRRLGYVSVGRDRRVTIHDEAGLARCLAPAADEHAGEPR